MRATQVSHGSSTCGLDRRFSANLRYRDIFDGNVVVKLYLFCKVQHAHRIRFPLRVREQRS